VVRCAELFEALNNETRATLEEKIIGEYQKVIAQAGAKEIAKADERILSARRTG
jgi:hypothetical protein